MKKSMYTDAPRMVYTVPVGSRGCGYGIETDDIDYYSIFCIPRWEVFEEPTFKFERHDGFRHERYFEISEIEKMILAGYPEICEIFWNQPTYRLKAFEPLHEIRNSLICRKSVESWLERSKKHFESARVKGTVDTTLNAIDFLTLIGKSNFTNPKAWSLRDCFTHNSLDLSLSYSTLSSQLTVEELTCTNIAGLPDAYSLYRNYGTKETPIIDDRGNLQVNPKDSITTAYVGVLIYDRKGHEKHKSKLNQRVKRGYEVRELAYAFRLLERIEDLIIMVEIKPKVSDPKFYNGILAGEHGLQYYASIYEKRLKEAEKLMKDAQLQPNINHIQLSRTIEEVRTKVEKQVEEQFVN